MSTEPTRHYSANWHSEISQARAELDERTDAAEMPRETPREARSRTNTTETTTDRGTPVPEPQKPAQAVECSCPWTDPSTWETYGGATEPGSQHEWEPSCPEHGDPSTVYIEPTQAVDTVARILVGTDWDSGVRNTDIGPRTAVAHMAAQADAVLRPVHYRELADQIEPVYPEAARLIRSVTKDLEDEGDTNG
jgi:hypothetical protein